MKLSSVFFIGLFFSSLISCSKGEDELLEEKENTNDTALVYNAQSCAVDMGTSVKWAAGNLGADKETDYGPYYAMNKLGSIINGGGTRGSGTGSDTRAILLPSQDPAKARLGGDWRMPTETEFYELIKICDIEWIFDYKGTNVAGKKFTSRKTNKSIFFPAAGGKINEELYGEGWGGNYWTASYTVGQDVLSEYKEFTYFSFSFDDLRLSEQKVHPTDAALCYSIRAVCEE